MNSQSYYHLPVDIQISTHGQKGVSRRAFIARVDYNIFIVKSWGAGSFFFIQGQLYNKFFYWLLEERMPYEVSKMME
jgi:hypothetical protein